MFGTGSIWAKELSSCALVDNTILLDCPNGLIKTLRRQKVNMKKIDLCIITHFHADHYFDLPFLLLEQGMHNIREKEFVLIGPKGLGEKVDTLFNLAYPELWEKVKENSKLQIIEVNSENHPIVRDGYFIRPYKVEHNGYDAYGYTIGNGICTIGFTGDTLYCPNVENIIRNSQMAFVDMSFEKNSKAHMGVNNIKYLKQEFADCHKIVPTHMSPDAREAYNRVYGDAPEDGAEYYI